MAWFDESLVCFKAVVPSSYECVPRPSQFGAVEAEPREPGFYTTTRLGSPSMLT